VLQLGRLQPFSQKLVLAERLASDKRSNLLRTFVNYEQKKFYNIGPWMQEIEEKDDFEIEQ